MNDQQLIDHMKDLLRRDAALDLEMIEGLREIFRRKLYLSHGCPSFHVFCTTVLGMSSDSAYRRMRAARVVDLAPEVAKPLIAEGKLHMSGLAMLQPVLTPENAERLLNEAATKSNTEIKAIIAREDPQPDVKSGARKLPSRPEQLREDTWKFQANIKADTHCILKEVQDLVGTNDCDAILREALRIYRDDLLVKRRAKLKRPPKTTSASPPVPVVSSTPATSAATEPATTGAAFGAGSTLDTAGAPSSFAATHRRCAWSGSSPTTTPQDGAAASVEAAPRTNQSANTDDAPMQRRGAEHNETSAYIPAEFIRLIFERDGHRCTFEGSGGRCTATRHLQVHHITPRALGGLTRVENLTLHCRAHNLLRARLDLGAWVTRYVGG